MKSNNWTFDEIATSSTVPFSLLILLQGNRPIHPAVLNTGHRVPRKLWDMSWFVICNKGCCFWNLSSDCPVLGVVLTMCKQSISNTLVFDTVGLIFVCIHSKYLLPSFCYVLSVTILSDSKFHYSERIVHWNNITTQYTQKMTVAQFFFFLLFSKK